MQSILSSSAQGTDSQTAKPSKLWWLVCTVVLALCIVIQMPAVWIVNQFLPNSPYIQQVSGNVWQGSVVFRAPIQSATESSPLSGTLAWQFKPLSLFLGRLSSDIEITSGSTRLDGEVSRGLGGWRITDFTGKIDKQTLASIVNWQLPDVPIQVNALSAELNKENGFRGVDGQLTWAGGELGYPSGGKTFTLLMPAMHADLTQESRNNNDVIHANLLDSNSKRLGDIYLGPDGMLDVELTQRLLEHMPSYKGSAPADTAVISVRQPLISSMANGGVN